MLEYEYLFANSNFLPLIYELNLNLEYQLLQELNVQIFYYFQYYNSLFLYLCTNQQYYRKRLIEVFGMMNLI